MRRIQKQELPVETIREQAERYVYEGVLAASLWEQNRAYCEKFWAEVSKLKTQLQEGVAA